MKFCSNCGKDVVVAIPPGDHLPRYVCETCGAIHYQNPRLIVGCLAEWQDRILLCRRAIDPRKGFWTLPAGFMENHETMEQAAIRETAEEALAEVETLEPLALVSVPHISQVHFMFRAKLQNGRHAAGAESLETRLMHEHDIPWAEIAFPSVRYALERFCEDRRQGRSGFHISTWQQTAVR
jgi:ADP-ribose pyrophosphatase YjhB (NUDIX family)